MADSANAVDESSVPTALPLPYHRIFDPSLDAKYNKIPADELIVNNQVKKVFQLQMQDPSTGALRFDSGTVVMQICTVSNCRFRTPRRRRNSDPKAAWGLYVYGNSPYNANGLVADALPQTTAFSSMDAISRALDFIGYMASLHHSLCDFKIVSNCSWAAQVLSFWAERLAKNDGVQQPGMPLTRYTRIKQVNDKFHAMENRGIKIQFWFTKTFRLKETRALAKVGLKGHKRGPQV
ncbi:hypothetical protein F5Y12DRAFT_90203 [Xylaria sp. FL1777]|nr:hypothetical protein F5Y12DRAFT_90203 [Xylaria sp. FL1777]